MADGDRPLRGFLGHRGHYFYIRVRRKTCDTLTNFTSSLDVVIIRTKSFYGSWSTMSMNNKWEMASEAIEAAYTTYYLHCNKAYTDFIISYLTRQMARKSLFCSWRSRMFIILLLYLPIRIENRNTYTSTY